MTTYFFHNPNGTTYSQIMHNVAPLWNSYGSLTKVPELHNGLSSTAHYDVGSGEFVPGPINAENNEAEGGYYSDAIQGSMLTDHAGYEFSSVVPNAAAGYGQLSEGYRRYGDPELIRKYHSLHTLLPYIEPARLHNSASGPTLDIVEEHTGHVFAFAVPKKMLVLFCGRKVINRFLRTLGREDKESCEDGKPVQLLQFPCNYTNHIGVKVVINWMHRACRSEPSDMRPINIPKELFAAISLARALTVLGLHRDASYVDHVISDNHFARPLHFDEIVSVWKYLPKNSKYTYRMIEELRNQLQCPTDNDKNEVLNLKNFTEFLEKNPELKARVENKEYNNRDEFRPFFGTDWCVKAAILTQKILGGAAGEDLKISEGKGRSNRENCGGGGSNKQPRNGRRMQKKSRIQSQKTIAFKDWKPHSHPTIWPEFEKTVVLKIAGP